MTSSVRFTYTNYLILYTLQSPLPKPLLRESTPVKVSHISLLAVKARSGSPVLFKHTVLTLLQCYTLLSLSQNLYHSPFFFLQKNISMYYALFLFVESPSESRSEKPLTVFFCAFHTNCDRFLLILFSHLSLDVLIFLTVQSLPCANDN